MVRAENELRPAIDSTCNGVTQFARATACCCELEIDIVGAGIGGMSQD